MTVATQVTKHTKVFPIEIINLCQKYHYGNGFLFDFRDTRQLATVAIWLVGTWEEGGLWKKLAS